MAALSSGVMTVPSRASTTSAMETMLATGKPYFSWISCWAVTLPPLPTSMRLRLTMRPLTSTFAAPVTLG